MYSYWNSITEEWVPYDDMREMIGSGGRVPSKYTYCKEHASNTHWERVRGNWRVTKVGPVLLVQGELFDGY